MQQNATSWRKKADVESHPETARVGHQPKASVLDDLGMGPNNQLSFHRVAFRCLNLAWQNQPGVVGLKVGFLQPRSFGGGGGADVCWW